MKFNLKILKLKKHTAVIAITCFITFVISMYILFLISSADSHINEAQIKIKTLDFRIQSLLRFPPSPTKENIHAVKNDSKYMENEIFTLKTTLGNPYIKPLKKMLAVLNSPKKANASTKEKSSNLRTFLASWKDFYNKNQKNKPVSIDSFVVYLSNNQYSEEIIKNAIKAFHDSLQAESYMNIDLLLSDNFLLYALGAPLKISRIQCRKYIEETQSRINTELKRNKLLASSKKIILFSEFTTMPNDDQIPYINHYLWFYDDLIKKLISSKIETLVSYKKLNGLRGTKENNTIVLKYEIVVLSSLSSIRNLFNALQNSYNENRIYKIDALSFNKLVDNVEKLNPPGKQRKPTIEIILGRSNLVKAKIDLSYFIYNTPLVEL